jgi:hypothetical protein
MFLLYPYYSMAHAQNFCVTSATSLAHRLVNLSVTLEQDLNDAIYPWFTHKLRVLISWLQNANSCKMQG